MASVRRFEIDHGWTPRRLPGGVFCSPRCGCQCTQAAHDAANRESQELAHQLGIGWVPRVWENAGWHWQVAKGPCAEDENNLDGGVIVRQRGDVFHAEFRSALTGTNAVAQFFAEAKTAEDAIGAVRQDVRTFISRIEADLASSL